MSRRLNVTFEDNIAVIELTRLPNELNNDFLVDFNWALDRVLSNEEAQTLVTYSTGKHFSNGIAVGEVFGEGTEAGMLFMKGLCDVLIRLLTFPLPTIAAINGHAFAGGCLLALSHDYRVMNADKGWLSMPEINMPSMFPITLMEILRAKVPAGNAQRDVITMGRRLTGKEALSMRLVDEICPGSELVTHTKSMAQRLLRTNGRPYDRQAMADMKQDLYRDVLRKQGNFDYLPPTLVKPRL